MRKVCT